ncbi:nif-specific transcriptional activator NifA [Afifella sp. IM 167]|uniref:nif-specific transcriptional activator NifA n=1 Tax=Afifella sp. IM 167 TaxID=2033586 RepID=UPI00351D3B9D|nr:nif-specific transcriptional activator NifA [Afifella sp. IM 167]
MTISNVRAFGHNPRATSRAEVELTGIYEISKVLGEPCRLEAMLASVLSLLSSFLDMRHGLIALLDPEGEPEIVVGSGWSEASAQRYFRRLPEEAIGRIVATGMPLVVANVLNDRLFAGSDLSGWGPDDGMPFSLIGVPIKNDGAVIGTLTIDRAYSDLGQVPFDQDVRFLTLVANLVGQTLRLHRTVARDRERLMAEQHRLEKELSANKVMPEPEGEAKIAGIIGDSPALVSALDKVRIVARSRSAVLLRGESGTGKELFASAIHDLSPRREGPFVKLNCAALPESVLESEIFGHEKGAFTGALAQRKGRFELADRGTLFLDEIGEISHSFQAKLLRVLQEGEFERVGGSKSLKVDVRLVCATNRDLEAAVARGEFRADLYYRISVVPIFLPPLRDRTGDVPLLAADILRRFNKEHGTSLTLTQDAMSVLSGCYFPGNVRELENCIRRTATLSREPRIGASAFACREEGCLSSTLWQGGGRTAAPTHPGGFTPLPVMPAHNDAGPVAPRPVAQPGMTSSAVQPVQPVASEAAPPAQPSGAGVGQHACPAPGACPVPGADMRSERDRLVEAMETAGWVQAKAARILGMTPRQIGYALRKHSIPIKKF